MKQPNPTQPNDAKVDLGSYLARFKYFIKTYSIIAIPALLFLSVALVAHLNGAKIPRTVFLALYGYISMVIFSTLPAFVIIQHFRDPVVHMLLVHEAENRDFALYAFGKESWADLHVEDGELYRLNSIIPVWECQTYDPETHTATASWRGLVSDMQLAKDKGSIKDLKTEFLEVAQQALAETSSHSRLAWENTDEMTREHMYAIQEGMQYEGDGLRNSLDRIIDQSPDLDDRPDDERKPDTNNNDDDNINNNEEQQ